MGRSLRSVIILRSGNDTEIDTSCTLSPRKNFLATKTFFSFRLTLIVSSTPPQPSTSQKSLSLADFQNAPIFGARFQQCESCSKLHPLPSPSHPSSSKPLFSAVKKICDIYDWDGKGELDLFYLGDIMYAMGYNTTKKVTGFFCFSSSSYSPD